MHEQREILEQTIGERHQSTKVPESKQKKKERKTKSFNPQISIERDKEQKEKRSHRWPTGAAPTDQKTNRRHGTLCSLCYTTPVGRALEIHPPKCCRAPQPTRAWHRSLSNPVAPTQHNQDLMMESLATLELHLTATTVPQPHKRHRIHSPLAWPPHHKDPGCPHLHSCLSHNLHSRSHASPSPNLRLLLCKQVKMQLRWLFFRK